MDRRTYLKTGVSGITALTLAGCAGGGSGGGSEGGSSDGSSGGSGGSDGSDGGTDTAGSDDSGSSSGDDSESSLPDSVVIGSDIPYPPFEFKNNDGEVVGFDVDIAQAVFEEQLGIDYEFQQNAFDTIIPALNNGNFRVIMSAMTITEERDQKVDFSDPYYTAFQTIAVLKDSDITSKEDLKGKAVGVQKGTTGEKAAEELKKEFDGDLTLKRYDLIPDAFSALKNNQVVAVVNDNSTNAQYVDENPDQFRFVEGEGVAAEQGLENAPPYLTLTVEQYGIAFREDDDAFREQVNGALATIKENGTYDDIYAEYFSG